MDATPQKGFQPEAQAKEVPAPRRNAAFIVTSELLMRVDELVDLPPGQNVVKSRKGEFSYFETSRIPMEDLLVAISEGRIYAKWGANMAFLDEMHPDWALSALHKPRRIDAFEQEWPRMERAIRVPSVSEKQSLTAAPEAPGDGSLQPEGGPRDDGKAVKLNLNYKGQYIELHAATMKDLLDLAQLKAETDPHFLKKEAYAAAAREILREHPELRPALEPKPVAPKATQGTLL